MTAATINRPATNVGMGQIAIVKENELAKAVLGSCIGLVLYDPSTKMAAVAHIVLPENKMASATPGKFANTAVPEMLSQLENAGANRARVIAKIAGGASMFIASGSMEIGKTNCEAVIALLKSNRIRLAGEHTGGDKGRKVSFDPATGEYAVEQVNGEPAVI